MYTNKIKTISNALSLFIFLYLTSFSQATSYQYDGMNRLTQATFDDGTHLEYKYGGTQVTYVTY